MNLFELIKTDNIKEFKAAFEAEHGTRNACFGRFPALSLAYLYGAKKIVKAFEQKLARVVSYEILEEPDEVYKKFGERAGRAYRLFAGEEGVVTPAEMLAATGEGEVIPEIWGFLPESSKDGERLNRILAAAGSGIRIEEKKPANVPKYTKRKKAKMLKITAVVMICVAVISILLGTLIPYGLNQAAGKRAAEEEQKRQEEEYNRTLGTEVNPIKITSSVGLLEVSGGKFYDVAEDVQVENFTGTLDGGGATVKASGKKPLFATNSGTIKNVNFVFTHEGIIELGESSGLVCGVNAYIIENCTAFFKNINLKGTNETDKYFGAFAGINTGTITGCSTADGSKITADTVDVAGIAGENRWRIINCKNYAELHQFTEAVKWTPNVAGITCYNIYNSNGQGTVTGCYSYGKISAEHKAEGGEIALGLLICIAEAAAVTEDGLVFLIQGNYYVKQGDIRPILWFYVYSVDENGETLLSRGEFDAPDGIYYQVLE